MVTLDTLSPFELPQFQKYKHVSLRFLSNSLRSVGEPLFASSTNATQIPPHNFILNYLPCSALFIQIHTLNFHSFCGKTLTSVHVSLQRVLWCRGRFFFLLFDQGHRRPSVPVQCLFGSGWFLFELRYMASLTSNGRPRPFRQKMASNTPDATVPRPIWTYLKLDELNVTTTTTAAAAKYKKNSIDVE